MRALLLTLLQHSWECDADLGDVVEFVRHHHKGETGGYNEEGTAH